MPRIKCITPFGLRLNSDTPKREFKAKQTYTLSAEEYNHWFIQGCLEEGRAIEVAEKPAEQPAEKPAENPDDELPEELYMPTVEELMKLKLGDLKELAIECKIEVAADATKTQIATALVEGPHNGLYVVKTPDGLGIAGE